MVLRKLGRANAGLVFDVRINDALFKAALDHSRELLSASLLWSDFGGERCRFRVGSISMIEASRRIPGKEWLAESIKLGDQVCVKPYRSLPD